MNPTKVKVTVENLAPENGSAITPLWVGFHDGTFDLFNLGEPASPGIESTAEDGITGLGGNFPDLTQASIDAGFDPAILPSLAPFLSDLFSDSSAGMNDGIQDLLFIASSLGLNPGESVSKTFELNDIASNGFFSYAAMYFASNDAFIANDNPIPIVDESGNLIETEIIITGDQVWDAGTEVNTEDPADVPFDLAVTGQGTPEGGVVMQHPGFLPPGSGGILDNPDFANSDFTQPGYEVARITITEVPEPNEVVFSASGNINGIVELFRDVVDMGGVNNGNEIGSQGDGFREIDWDGGAVPFNMPANFFNNQNRPVNGLPRGVEFSTASNFSLFGVSNPVLPADPFFGDNEFDTFNSTYPDQFTTFSSPRLFAPLDLNFMDVDFFEPGVFDEDGNPVPALVTGFGAIFTDVDLPDSTKLEFFDGDGDLLLSQFVEPDPEGLSFLGVVFDQPVVSKVRITSGNVPLRLGLEDDPFGTGVDVVAMDNFIYGEPVVA